LDVEFFAGADDSECDFATVCDEDSLEHVEWPLGTVLEMLKKRAGSPFYWGVGGGGLVWFDHVEWLSELYGVAVFDAEFGDGA